MAFGVGACCVKCQRIMKPVHVGACLEELTETGEPYKLWQCDIWACPACGFEVVYGVGDGPIAQAYNSVDYEEMKARMSITRIVSAR